MKYTTYIAGTLFVLALSLTAHAAENDDLLNTVTASPDIAADAYDIDPDDSVEDDLDAAIAGIAGNTAPAAKAKGSVNKSEVAKAVADLLDTADLDRRVGDEVRVLANEQSELFDDLDEKMQKVSERESWLVFLIGADYDTLGELRSSLITSENGLMVLKQAKEKAHVTLQDDIDTQVAVLEAEVAKARTFIEESEQEFSLFGWLVKLF